MCLEEMLGTVIPQASFFYGQPRRRQEVALTDELRHQTESLATRLHELTDLGVTPIGEYSKRCRSCSLMSICLPKATANRGSVARYLARALAEGEQ